MVELGHPPLAMKEPSFRVIHTESGRIQYPNLSEIVKLFSLWETESLRSF